VTSLRLAGVLVLIGCSSTTAPTVGDGIQRLDAPAIYRTWYSEVKACSGLTGNYDALTLRTATNIAVGNDVFSGYWTPPHTITIRFETVWLYDETLIKHEFLHDVLQRGDHPAQYFNGVCGNLLIQ
jgi:hypothetical protein